MTYVPTFHRILSKNLFLHNSIPTNKLTDADENITLAEVTNVCTWTMQRRLCKRQKKSDKNYWHCLFLNAFDGEQMKFRV